MNILMQDANNKDSYYFDGVLLTFVKDTIPSIVLSPAPSYFGATTQLSFDYTNPNPYRLNSAIRLTLPSSFTSSSSTVPCISSQFSSPSTCTYSSSTLISLRHRHRGKDRLLHRRPDTRILQTEQLPTALLRNRDQLLHPLSDERYLRHRRRNIQLRLHFTNNIIHAIKINIH